MTDLCLRLALCVCTAALMLRAPASAAWAQTVESVLIEESADFVARDTRISFDQRSANFARVDLDELEPGDYGRSSALVTLGAARSVRSRPRLMEEVALGRDGDERAAAALALGELGERSLGPDGEALIVRLLDDPDPKVARAAMVALVRVGSSGGRQAVANVAARGNELSAEARQILAHHIDPRGTDAPETFQTLYQLRWDAARTYGLVDGKVWTAALLGELAQNQAFLEALTLQLTETLDFPGAKDHLLEILLEGIGAPRIVRAVHLMPAEVEILVDSGVWRPQDLKEWKWLVLTILSNELQALFPQTLLQSMQLENSPARWIAAGLLYHEDRQFGDILDEGFRHKSADVQAFAMYAAAASELQAYVERLKERLEDPDVWIQANAIAGLIRMGSPLGVERAINVFDTPLEDRPRQLVSLLFEVLERAAPDPDVMLFVETVAPNLSGDDRAAADALLLIHGALVSSDHVRRQLPLLNPIFPEAHRCVRALATVGGDDDIQLLGRLFPRDSAPVMNVELSVALAQAAHRAPEPLLQAAVWTLPYDQSVLAAGCVYHTYGEATLLDWVADPPASATKEDVRRVGWAIGEWGGLPAVQALQKKLGTTNGAELVALQGAAFGALAARTR